MALRCALEDTRIRGIATAGAPIREFFTEGAWRSAVPRITRDTLAHLIATDPADLSNLSAWALSERQLAALDVPLHYVASRRDEIVPRSELGLLRGHVHDLHLLECDDVHGLPRHVAEMRVWAAGSVLRMRDALPAQRAALGVLLWMLRARRTLSRSPA